MIALIIECFSRGVDVSTVNQGVTREVTTVMVLNQMMRCLERQGWSEGLMKTVQLTWLYRSAINILQGDQSSDKWSKLYGILHAILLLLAGRVASAQHPRNAAAGNEMMLLVFSRDPRFNIMYTLLLNELEQFSSSENTCDAPKNENISDVSSSSSLNDQVDKDEKKKRPEGRDGDGEWVGPALLILDIIAQSLLVDNVALKVFILYFIIAFVSMYVTSYYLFRKYIFYIIYF